MRSGQQNGLWSGESYIVQIQTCRATTKLHWRIHQLALEAQHNHPVPMNKCICSHWTVRRGISLLDIVAKKGSANSNLFSNSWFYIAQSSSLSSWQCSGRNWSNMSGKIMLKTTQKKKNNQDSKKESMTIIFGSSDDFLRHELQNINRFPWFLLEHSILIMDVRYRWLRRRIQNLSKSWMLISRSQPKLV